MDEKKFYGLADDNSEHEQTKNIITEVQIPHGIQRIDVISITWAIFGIVTAIYYCHQWNEFYSNVKILQISHFFML